MSLAAAKTVAFRAPTGIIVTAFETPLPDGRYVYTNPRLFDDDEYLEAREPELPFGDEHQQRILTDLPPMPDDMLARVML